MSDIFMAALYVPRSDMMVARPSFEALRTNGFSPPNSTFGTRPQEGRKEKGVAALPQKSGVQIRKAQIQNEDF
jgi:hypothetical protein